MFKGKKRNITCIMFQIAFMTHFLQCINVVANSATENSILLQFTKICEKIERDCYVDCGRNTNIKSVIVEHLWVTCTKYCDKQYRQCKRKSQHRGKNRV